MFRFHFFKSPIIIIINSNYCSMPHVTTLIDLKPIFYNSKVTMTAAVSVITKLGCHQTADSKLLLQPRATITQPPHFQPRDR